MRRYRRGRRGVYILALFGGIALLLIVTVNWLSAANTPVGLKGTILQMENKTVELIINPIQSYKPGEKITVEITDGTQIIDNGKEIGQDKLKTGMYVKVVMQQSALQAISGTVGGTVPALRIEIVR